MSLQNKLCVSIAQGRKEQIIDKAKKYPFIEFCLEKLDCTVEELDSLRHYINRVIISCNIKRIYKLNPSQIINRQCK